MYKWLLGIGGLLVFLGLVFLPAQASGTFSGPQAVLTPGPDWNFTYLPVILNNPDEVPPDPSLGPHGMITKYEGPQTCVACHAAEAESALHSEHMAWAGKWNEVNTYCTSPAPADYACLSCHVSTGKVTNQTVNDVDCLVCHQDQYQRSLQPLSIDVTVTDWQGNQKTYHTPAKNTLGDYTFVPRFDLMAPGTTMVQLARTVHLPTRASCLRCHAKAGGGDGVKRGDLSTVTIDPPYTSDVHMSKSGADLACQDCHEPDNHLIPGKGIDLRINEGGSVKACSECHGSAPHNNSNIDKHTKAVACQTCHIPEYGKDVATEMSRDWREPVWNPGGCSGQGAWIGHEVKQSNVVPQYVFWNGASSVYSLSDPIAADPNGMFTMARALGSIQDGKIFPIKVHTAWQPRHDASGRMVQYDVLWNFWTGFFEQAAARGVEYMGLNGSYTWVQARADQLITHGVEPAESALQCADCHGGTRLNFTQLGYGLKSPQGSLCQSCHEHEANPGFTKIHDEHVRGEDLDCVSCHNFSRATP